MGTYGPAEGLPHPRRWRGQNSCRSRVWKQQLQEQLCDPFGLRVTVCHYPTGCSKWNPVEHRLFGPISRNWAGHPLRTWETMLAYLRGTTSTTGLSVTAEFHKRSTRRAESCPMPRSRTQLGAARDLPAVELHRAPAPDHCPGRPSQPIGTTSYFLTAP